MVDEQAVTSIWSPSDRTWFMLQNASEVRVGRGSLCKLQVIFPEVSSEHFVLTRDEENRWWIRDLESANGTQLNGVLLTQARYQLQQGMEIQVMNRTLLISLGEEFRLPVRAHSPSSFVERAVEAYGGKRPAGRAIGKDERRVRAIVEKRKEKKDDGAMINIPPRRVWLE